MVDRRGWSVIEGLLLVLCIMAIAWAGVTVRREVWTRTETLRYVPDMQNAWEWGSRAGESGLFKLYDEVARTQSPGSYQLDYMPLRLSAVTLWVHSRMKGMPTPTDWQRDYAFNAPLLRFNLFCEAMTAVGIGLLVLDFSRRDRRPTLLGISRPLYGLWPAMLAATLVWLNPAALVSAHGRPTWDVWVTPFYVWAVWLATRQCWFIAGLILASGTMLKGQQLFAVPLFLLWPIMGLRLGATARVALGFGLGLLLIGLPWTMPASPKVVAMDVGVALLPVAAWLAFYRWPIFGKTLPLGRLRWLVPTALLIALVGNIALLDGSVNWLRIGLVYGADKFQELESGGAASLAGLLTREYGWEADDLVISLQSLCPGATISHVMAALDAVGLVAISGCVARTEKCGRRGFLLAIAAPWIMYFAIFPKMHERYLLWGALVACAGVGVNVGSVGLALFFSACSTAMSLRQMADGARRGGWSADRGSAAYQVWEWLSPIYPGLAWAVLLSTAVWLWMTFATALAARRRPAAKPAERLAA